MTTSGERSFPTPLVASAAATVVIWLAHAVVRESAPPGDSLRLALTVLLIIAFGATIWFHFRLTASVDEFARHVQFAALRVAFPTSLVVAFAIGFLAGEGFFQRADPRDLPLVMLVSYAVSLAVAWRRYR